MRRTICFLLFLMSFTTVVVAQSAPDSLSNQGSLQNCIHYALMHQPILHKSILDEEITEHSIQSKLADWYLNWNLVT